MFWNGFSTKFDKFSFFSFEILSILSQFVVNWDLADLCEPDSGTLPVIPENQLARRIQSKSIRGLGAGPPYNTRKVLNFSTKSTISQKPKMVKIGKLIFHSLGSLRIFSVNFDIFERFFLVSDKLEIPGVSLEIVNTISHDSKNENWLVIRFTTVRRADLSCKCGHFWGEGVGLGKNMLNSSKSRRTLSRFRTLHIF